MLIGLPRNMTNFPFAQGSVMHKAWPHGFNCGYPNCELNGIPTWVGDHPALFKGVKNPAMNGTISAIEGITGLKINYWAMVNLAGFRGLVDAVGGVTLNVRQPIPVGGLGADVTGYIKPGIRKLNGYRHAVVRPVAGQLRRLLADGPAEVRDERDAPPGQPADRAHELREDRQGLVGR